MAALSGGSLTGNYDDGDDLRAKLLSLLEERRKSL